MCWAAGDQDTGRSPGQAGAQWRPEHWDGGREADGGLGPELPAAWEGQRAALRLQDGRRASSPSRPACDPGARGTGPRSAFPIRRGARDQLGPRSGPRKGRQARESAVPRHPLAEGPCRPPRGAPACPRTPPMVVIRKPPHRPPGPVENPSPARPSREDTITQRHATLG